jgi:L-alanine-DL-glutamate epimerase-like enolase superfamily enzyme
MERVRLTSVEVIPYALPFKRPYVTARGTLTQREMVLLRLNTDSGLVGLGEAVPLSMRDGGVTLAQVVKELEETDRSEALHHLVESGHLDYSAPESLDPRLVLSHPAQFAVLTALDDLRAKMGEHDSPARTVTCNATLIAGEPAAVAADAEDWASDGFTSFKMKLGTDEDVDQVRAVRAVLGPGAKIRVDANASWSLQTATRTMLELEQFDIELAEQPVETIEESADLAAATSIPLSGDESVVTREDAEYAAELNAFQATGIKLSKVGGYVSGLEIAEALPAYVSSSLDGPIGIAAGASLASSLDYDAELRAWPKLAHGLATQRLFASTIAAVEPQLRGGRLHIPHCTGLGVEIDEDALQAHRL